MSIFQTAGQFYDSNFWFCNHNLPPSNYSDVNYLNSFNFTREGIIFSEWEPVDSDNAGGSIWKECWQRRGYQALIQLGSL